MHSCPRHCQIHLQFPDRQFMMKFCQSSFPVMFPMVQIGLKDRKHSQLLIQKVCGALWPSWKGKENEILQTFLDNQHSVVCTPGMGWDRAQGAVLGLSQGGCREGAQAGARSPILHSELSSGDTAALG